MFCSFLCNAPPVVCSPDAFVVGLFWLLSVVLSLWLCGDLENHPASVFLSAHIMAVAFTGRVINSLETQSILLSTHYSANCIYPGEKHTVPRCSFHHSTPQRLPSVNNRRDRMSLLVWSHSDRYRCIFPLMSVTEVFSCCYFVCLYQTFSQRGGEEEGLSGNLVTDPSPAWVLSTQ